jgi:hypothetical protein
VFDCSRIWADNRCLSPNYDTSDNWTEMKLTAEGNEQEGEK